MRHLTSFLTLLGLVTTLFLVGCGGGGGGGLATLSYSTDWTNYAAANGGKSQRVQLFSPNGALVLSSVLNQGTATISTASFPGLSSGVYHLEVQLFSDVNASGTEVGDFDRAVNVSNSLSLSTLVGATPAALSVTSSASTVAVQQSTQFYVGATTSAGAYTFVQTGSVTWSVLGTVGTVNATTGLFLGTSAGTGSVRASQATSGLNSSAPIVVTAITTTQGTWTVLVYMNAANDLSQFSITNINQMESVALPGATVRTVVQWKQVSSLPYPAQFNGTRRYLIQPDQTSGIGSQLVQDMGSGVDMGSPQTLNDFVNWGKTYYPAQHYALIVWDHGDGWKRSPQTARTTRAVSYDDEFGTSIQTWQLSQALGNNHFDILAWDASLMQMAEVMDEIRGQVDYIVGSEESPPGAGYPYDLILTKFYNNPTDTPGDLSKAFVDGMIQGYAANATYKITQSVVQTSKLPAVITAINDLGTALNANVGSLTAAVQSARTNTQSYSLESNRFFFDLYDLTSKLDAGTSIPAITAADAEVRTAIGQAVYYEKHNTLSPGSHGISIDFSPGNIFVSYASDYQQLRLASDTVWGTWLSQAP